MELVIAESRINSTQSTTRTTCLATIKRDIIIFYKNTILAADYLSDEFPISVWIDHSLCVYLFLRFLGKIVPYNVKRILQQSNFLNSHRSTSIALHATNTMTFRQVTAEHHLEQIK